jgi:hypothetical protein
MFPAAQSLLVLHGGLGVRLAGVGVALWFSRVQPAPAKTRPTRAPTSTFKVGRDIELLRGLNPSDGFTALQALCRLRERAMTALIHIKSIIYMIREL